MKQTDKEREYQRLYYLRTREVTGPRRRKAATEWTRNQRRAKRTAALDALGGECVKCGFSDRRALQIDHVNGGGRAELLKFGMHQSGYYGKDGYLDQVIALATSGVYQLLCANCNWIKRVEEKET